jgi:hypothetical protein
MGHVVTFENAQLDPAGHRKHDGELPSEYVLEEHGMIILSVIDGHW